MSGCTFPNLFDFHPPFQLDGNFGGSAGIAEILLQSHEGYIEPLAALPENWKSGEFSGFCARGGFEIYVKWNNNKAEKIIVTSKQGGTCRIKTELNKLMNDGSEMDFVKCEDGIISFETSAGGVYELEI